MMENKKLIAIAAALMLILAINVIKAQIGQQQPSQAVNYPFYSCHFNTDNIITGNVEGFSEGCFKDIQKKCDKRVCYFYEQGKLRAKCSLVNGKLDCYV